MAHSGPSAADTKPATTSNNAMYRTLNVKDALSYLDEVKVQFTNQPDVYNKFLDIMKDFKTQSIDTPGVITRVSSLFRGHPSLIQGFNTFLPPGYKLDCSSDPTAMDHVTITTPTGTTIKSSLWPPPEPVAKPPVKSEASTPTHAAAPFPRHSAAPSTGGVAAPVPAVADQATNAPPAPATTHRPHPTPSNAPTVTTTSVSFPPITATRVNTNLPPTTAPAPPVDRPLPIATPPQQAEFNHAINYVNKIKLRFANDPSTYKIFLEILQTYQKEQRPIQEVYAEVTQLFSSAPDLLDEFKQFLPDQSAAPAPAPSYQVGDKRSATTSSVQQPRKKQKPEELPKKRGAGKRILNETSAPTTTSTRGRGRGRGGRRAAAANDRLSPPGIALSPPPPASQWPAPATGFLDGSAPSPFPKGYAAPLPGQTLVSVDELSFFEKVKKEIDDRTSYQHFLKLLNLFTQDLIDVPTLMEKAHQFFGHDEALFAEFKSIVGWEPVIHGLIEGEEWIVDNIDALDRPRIDLGTLPSHGPSYKRLPASEVELACSGRDALCWSVLNDDWVAHATWASEGSGVYRKNLSEEAMAFCEQERHWFSIVAETNARAIALLDPILTRIEMMEPDQRTQFKLRQDHFGGSKSIIERAVKKIYGSDALGAASGTRQDHAQEVISSLYDTTGIALPVVLARMKQKDKDWKRALREWNKVWREVDCKNYYQSLDHQSGSYKVNDKRTTTPKFLMNEIEQLRKERKQKRVSVNAAAGVQTSRPHVQFELHMDDKQVILDVLRLTFHYLEHGQCGLLAAERERVEGFLRLLIPLVFGISRDELEHAFGAYAPKHATDDDYLSDSDNDATSEGGNSTADDRAQRSPSVMSTSSRQSRRPAPRIVAADLRRRLLLSHRDQMSKPSSPEDSKTNGKPGTTVTHKVNEHSKSLGAETTWIQASTEPWLGGPAEQRGRRDSVSMTDAFNSDCTKIDKRQSFFCGSTLYSLVRMFHMMYHRLSTLKVLAAEQAANYKFPRLNPLAVDLGLVVPLPIIDLPSNEGEPPAAQYYDHMLDLCGKLFSNEINNDTFEEHLRYMWGAKAFQLFTIDKLAASLIKHAQAANSDAKCQDMILLLEKDRAAPEATIRQQIAYRMEVESALDEDDHLYRVEWVPSANVLAIQLLGHSDLTLDDVLNTPQQRFAYYCCSYGLSTPTEGVGREVKCPAAKRNFKLASKAQGRVQSISDAQVKLGQDTFKLFHVAKTGDVIVRDRTDEDVGDAELEEIRIRRREQFEEWLNAAVESLD